MSKIQKPKKFKTLEFRNLNLFRISIFEFRILLAIVFSFLLLSPAYAAELFFGVQNPSVGVGSVVEVGVLLNTEGESINAVEGKILFPSNVVRLKEIRDGNSLVNLWIQKPSFAPSTPLRASEGEVSFSGLVPGGFTGEAGYLFSLFFEAIQPGEARVETDGEQALLADGQGSKAVIKKAPLVFDVVEEEQAVNELAILEDSTPPEPFSPQVSRDASIFDGKWFVIFLAQDKGFGISRYEVQEGAGAWEKSASPYLLKDQSLRSLVSVKAVDKAGNERIETLAAQNPMRWYESWFVWGILGGVGILIAVWKVLKIRSTKHEIRNNDQDPKAKKL